MSRTIRRPLLVLCLAAPFLLPTLAAAATVDRGIDLWQTRAQGSTFADFAKFPIPAGFFCSRSEAFAGKIALRGVPLATDLPGELGATDTIVERLDSPSFDKSGTAVTRIKVRALELASVAPLKTACGDYTLRVTLHGNQPITRMQIVREGEGGGHFSAPLEMNLKLTFIPASGKSGGSLELLRNHFRLAADPEAPWAADPAKRSLHRQGPVSVDTDGDSIPDTVLPGTSAGFVAGLRPSLDKYIDCSEVCHIGDDGEHCTFVSGDYCL